MNIYGGGSAAVQNLHGRYFKLLSGPATLSLHCPSLPIRPGHEGLCGSTTAHGGAGSLLGQQKFLVKCTLVFLASPHALADSTKAAPLAAASACSDKGMTLRTTALRHELGDGVGCVGSCPKKSLGSFLLQLL